VDRIDGIFEVTTSSDSVPSKPGSYSMTFFARGDKNDIWGGRKSVRKAYCLTLNSNFLLDKFEIPKLELVADLNRQEGGPLRVMLGKPLSYYLLPKGLDPSRKKELLNDVELELNHDKTPWNNDETNRTNKFHVIVRRNPANRSTFISLPRFAIRELLDEQEQYGERIRYKLRFLESSDNDEVGHPHHDIQICRFDSRSSTMKPEGRGWFKWNSQSLEKYNQKSFEIELFRID
jgi:hypothetical protein